MASSRLSTSALQRAWLASAAAQKGPHKALCGFTSLSSDLVSLAGEEHHGGSFLSKTWTGSAVPQRNMAAASFCEAHDPGVEYKVASTSVPSSRGFASSAQESAAEEKSNFSDGSQEGADKASTSDAADESTKVLEAALKHVATLGWTQAALVQGAKDASLSPAFVGNFSRGPVELVEFFLDNCDDRFSQIMKGQEEELANMLLADRLVHVVRTRLELQTPYVTTWPQALSLQARPENVLRSLERRAKLVDTLWRAVGDESSDASWYAKRASLAVVYSTTEVYMLTDFSSEFRDTWAFLERQVGVALQLGNSAEELSKGEPFAAALPGLFNGLRKWKQGPWGPWGPKDATM